MGIVSSLGNDLDAVTESLRHGLSGIKVRPDYVEKGLRSLIAGAIEIDPKEFIDRKTLRFMGAAAAYAFISMQQAVADSNLPQTMVSHERTGIVMGSGGAGQQSLVEAADILRTKGLRKVGPYRVTQTMSSTTSACLATPFQIKGVNYSMSSACATSAHCIGHAAELIQMGKQDIVFAGGGEEERWELTHIFDAMRALSTGRNDTPDKASRAFDADRDGFVIAGGGGCVVMEELEHALARGATIYAELIGYGATSDGHDMVAPSGEGAVRCMRQALATVDSRVDYINAHGTSTPAGDVAELGAIREVFGDDLPRLASTKSLTGHSLGATGVQEAIYSLLMMRDDFISASANIENLDPAAEGMNVVRERIDDAGMNCALSNSFGFGGTNACLVFSRYSG
jgi:3-oxoacyl-[acyl-carrier-protein] synthase-1